MCIVFIDKSPRLSFLTHCHERLLIYMAISPLTCDDWLLVAIGGYFQSTWCRHLGKCYITMPFLHLTRFETLTISVVVSNCIYIMLAKNWTIQHLGEESDAHATWCSHGICHACDHDLVIETMTPSLSLYFSLSLYIYIYILCRCILYMIYIYIYTHIILIIHQYTATWSVTRRVVS